MAVPQRKYWRPKNLVMAFLNSLINADEPLHLEMRMQQSEFFFPAYVTKLREKVGLEIDRLLDDMERKGPVVDFVKMLSQELPLFTLCEMLGVDEDDRPKVKIWMHYLELASRLTSIFGKLFSQSLCFLPIYKSCRRDVCIWREGNGGSRRNPRSDLLSVIAQQR